MRRNQRLGVDLGGAHLQRLRDSDDPRFVAGKAVPAVFVGAAGEDLVAPASAITGERVLLVLREPDSRTGRQPGSACGDLFHVPNVTKACTD